MSQHLEAAIEAVAQKHLAIVSEGEALSDQSEMVQKMFRHDAELLITAALPDLRKHILQKLAREYQADHDNYVASRLRARLEKEERS